VKSRSVDAVVPVVAECVGQDVVHLLGGEHPGVAERQEASLVVAAVALAHRGAHPEEVQDVASPLEDVVLAVEAVDSVAPSCTFTFLVTVHVLV